MLGAIAAAGYRVRSGHDPDNEMARKLHVRYMVGGQARGIADERLYRFEFLERPGALLRFLQSHRHLHWNISLFHWTATTARTTAGCWPESRCPMNTRTDFYCISMSCSTLTEETDNAAYKIFLGA